MIDILFQDYNQPYAIPLMVIVILTGIEIVTMLLGLSVLGLLDDFIDFDIEKDTGLSSSGIGHLMCIDKVPFTIWLCIFLGCYGVTGLAFNQMSVSAFSTPLPVWISAPLAVLVGLVPARFFAGIFGKVMPKIESSAVNIDSLAGSIGQITIGKATSDTPAEAKVVDSYKQIHYVMVKPGLGETLSQGDDLVLFEKGNDNVWLCGRFDKKPLFEDR